MARTDRTRRSALAWLGEVLRQGYRDGGLRGMAARAPRFLREDLFGERLRWQLLTRPVSDGLVDRETLLEQAETQFADLVALTDRAGDHEPKALLDDLRDCLEDSAGIIRDEDGLRAGLDRLATLRRRASEMAVGDRTSRAFEYALDVGFALTVAEAVLRGALERTESRGAHYRRDYPETDETWRRNVVFERDGVGTMRLDHRAVDPPSERVQRALDAGYELEYHQLE